MSLEQTLVSALVAIGVYVIGQIFSKICLEPATELKRVVADIEAALHMHANLVGNLGSDLASINPAVWEGRPAAASELRGLSGKLRSRAGLVRGYGLAARTGLAPRRQAIEAAAGDLVSISNCLHGWRVDDMDEANFLMEESRKLLRLPYSQTQLDIWDHARRR